MKKLIPFLLLILISSHTIGQIQFVQNNKYKKIRFNTIKLDRSSFQLYWLQVEGGSLDIHLSYEMDSIIEAGKKGDLTIMKRYFTGIHAMAEDEVNPDKYIIVSKSGFNYWYYDNEADNRFDEILPYEDRTIAVRTISTLFFPYYSKLYPEKLFRLEDYPGKKLYMVYAYDTEAGREWGYVKIKLKG